MENACCWNGVNKGAMLGCMQIHLSVAGDLFCEIVPRIGSNRGLDSQSRCHWLLFPTVACICLAHLCKTL